MPERPTTYDPMLGSFPDTIPIISFRELNLCLYQSNVVERCPGRKRTILYRNKPYRIDAPDLVFLTTFPPSHVERRRCHVFAEHAGSWYSAHMPHIIDGVFMCLGSAVNNIITRRLMAGENPNLPELYWCSGFGADLVIGNPNAWTWKAMLTSGSNYSAVKEYLENFKPEMK